MEENNLSFLLGQTISSNFSFPIDPSTFSIPSTNIAPTTPFLGAVVSLPMDSSIPTSQNNLSAVPFDPAYHQFVMENQQPPPSQLDFTPTASLTSLLHSNDMTAAIGYLPTANHMPITANSSNTPLAYFPNTNNMPISPNPSNVPLTLFQSPTLPTQNNRYIYNFQMEAYLKSQLHSLVPLSTNLTLGNQVSYDIGYKNHNPYLNYPNPNYLHSMGINAGLNIPWNRPPLLHSTGRVYRCNTCRVEFPTAQAYGGHMSSHSKAKKAQEKLDATMRESKRAKLTRETYPSFDLSRRANANRSFVVEEEKKQVPDEGNIVERKGKNVMSQPVKEAEVIQIEIPGYISDESVNSEFNLQQKD